MTETTQRIDWLLATSSYTIWFNSQGEGSFVGIPVRNKIGAPMNNLYSIYQRRNGELVFLRVADK
jgi:hypothetical protein